MTRKEFNALAEILRDHKDRLDSGDTLAFSRLMADVRVYCKARNPNFDSDHFNNAVYGDSDA